MIELRRFLRTTRGWLLVAFAALAAAAGAQLAGLGQAYLLVGLVAGAAAPRPGRGCRPFGPAE